MSAFEGVTAMDEIVAEVTVSVAEPVIEPEVALIDVVPWASAFAKPWVGLELLMVAADGLDEAHVTLPVMFCVLPSL